MFFYFLPLKFKKHSSLLESYPNLIQSQSISYLLFLIYYFLSTISYLLSLYRPKYILKSLKNHLKSLTPPLHPLTPLFTPHYFNGSLVGNPAFLGYFFETGFTFSIITRDLAASVPGSTNFSTDFSFPPKIPIAFFA